MCNWGWCAGNSDNQSLVCICRSDLGNLIFFMARRNWEGMVPRSNGQQQNQCKNSVDRGNATCDMQTSNQWDLRTSPKFQLDLFAQAQAGMIWWHNDAPQITYTDWGLLFCNEWDTMFICPPSPLASRGVSGPFYLLQFEMCKLPIIVHIIFDCPPLIPVVRKSASNQGKSTLFGDRHVAYVQYSVSNFNWLND